MTTPYLNPITPITVPPLNGDADIKDVIRKYNELVMVINTSLIRQINDDLRLLNNPAP